MKKRLIKDGGQRDIILFGMLLLVGNIGCLPPQKTDKPVLSTNTTYTEFFPMLKNHGWEDLLCWWMKHLLEVGERPIYLLKCGDETHYRLFYNETWKGAAIIHIVNRSAGQEISCARWRTTNEGLRFLDRSTVHIHAEDFSKLNTLINRSDFWKRPQFPVKPMYTGGGRWLIEAVENHKYHFVLYETVESEMKEFCVSACRLAKYTRIPGGNEIVLIPGVKGIRPSQSTE
jgi:hypothetical protein